MRAPRPVTLVAATLPTSLGVSAASLLLPTAAGALDVPVTAVTALLSAYGWGMALAMPVTAAIATRRGMRAATVTGAAALALGAALVLAAPGLVPVTAGRVVLAYGAGAMTVAAMGAARDIAAPVRRQRVLSAVSAGIGLSGAVGPLLGALVADAWDWRPALAMPVLSLAALPFLLPGLSRAPQRRARIRPERRFFTASAAMLSLSTVYFALVYAVPQLLMAGTGLSRTAVGALLVAPGLLGAGASWGMAPVALRLGARRAALILGAVAAGSVAVAATGQTALVLAGSAASGFASAAGMGVLVAAATEKLAPESRPGGVGLFNFAFQLGSVAGPVLAAALGPGLAVLALLPLLALAVTGGARALAWPA